MNYWLMKSEPDAFGIEDLKSRPGRTEPWDGVRNYQARNFMRDAMKLGDPVFFYHSNCKVPGIVGIAEVASQPYPDPTQFDPDSKYYDPKSDPDDPRWVLVDVRFKRDLKRILSLAEIKDHGEALGDFALIRKGNRLSIMPLTQQQWDYLLGLEKS
ncbi:MAG: EVE domain-containing protein [Wenzhouxiangella sp.]|nr:EVE domain-containing protein [Wenzhouxiangella sp.]